MRRTAIIATAAVLAACHGGRGVGYYKAHGPERETRIDRCIVNGDDGDDCRAAKQAFYELHGIPASDGTPEAVPGANGSSGPQSR